MIRSLTYSLVILVLTSLYSCAEDEEPIDEVTKTTAGISFDPTPYVLNTKDIAPPVIAADNPLTVQGVKLGRMLFYEKKLSKDNSMSCASCHKQENGFSDTAQFSTGIRGLKGGRQAMAVVNMAWNTNEYFWDGRAHLLRDQSIMPIQDSLEMDETMANVIAKLSAEETYRNQFTRAFGSNEVNTPKIALALEQFMNSIISVDSKYDRFIRGEDTLNQSEERGRVLFFAEFNPGLPALSGADCQHCHSTRNFENDRYLNNGLDTDADMTDIGREAVTGLAGDKGKFKVTSLRNIALTMPYMHDGRFKTLEEVIDHYNTGLKNSSTIDPALIYPLNAGGLQLTAQDKTDLVNFMKTLTDETLITNPEYASPF